MRAARVALEEAIQNYVTDVEPGTYVVGYALIVKAVIPDRPGWTAYRYVVPIDQQRDVSIGLSYMLHENTTDLGADQQEDLDDEEG